MGQYCRIWLAPAVGLRFDAVNDPIGDALEKSQQNRVLSIRALLADANKFKLTRSNAVAILRWQDMLLRDWRSVTRELSGRMETSDLLLLDVTAKSIFQVVNAVY